MLSRPVTTTRRTALGVAAGLTSLMAACTTDSRSPASPADPTTSAPPEDADQELVASTAAQIAEAQVVVESLGRHAPALRGDLRPFRQMHAAHLEALGGFDGSVSAPRPSAGPPTAARLALTKAEQALQGQLVRAAVEAESGTLAKLLASMAAAIAQHLAVLR